MGLSENATTKVRLAAYSAGAISALGAASAHGSIVYSGTKDIAVGTGASQSINLDGDAFQDIRLKNYTFSGGPYQGAYVLRSPGSLVSFRAGASNFAYVTNLVSGTPIGSSSNFANFSGSMAFGANNPNAQFNTVTGAFLGFTFPNADKSLTYYAWMRVTINNATQSFVINDWAYENTGSAINAGATDVPEPTSLSMLAAGSAGLAMMRRRRVAAV